MIGSNARPLASARCLSCRDRLLHRRRLHARCLDDDVRRQCGARERLLHPVVCLDDLESTSGTTRAPAAARRSCSAGSGERDQQCRPRRSAESAGRRRTRSTIAPQIRPSPSSRRRRPTNGTRARSTLSPSRESSSGKHGQRPEHRDGDDEDRGQRERREGRVAGEEHARHRHHHGQAGDEHRAAGGRGRDLERRPLAAPRGAFLALALQVEQRVVDADGEPDQEHHRRGLHRDRQQDARERDEPERREHRGQREQERNAGRDERAEGEHEDDQRDRKRERAGLAEVLVVGVHDPLLCARVAELADREARMGTLRGGNACRGRDRSCRPPSPCRRGSGTRRVRSAGPSSGRSRFRAGAASGCCGRPRFSRRARRHPRSPHRRRSCRHVATDSGSGRARTRAARSPPRGSGPCGRTRPALPSSSMFFVPTMPPSPKATRTKASQPNVAVFQ